MIPTKNELKGGFGEYLTKGYSKLFTDALVLHDVLIDGDEGRTSQIDLILIGATGLYVVEVKNFMDAKIYGDGKKSKWYYYRGGKKFEFYNPLLQNKKHIAYLKTFLKDFGEIPFFSVLTVFCNDFKISNINAPGEKTTAVCSSLSAMREGIHLLAEGQPRVLDQQKEQAIYDFILAGQHQGREERQAHKEQVQEYKAAQKEMEKEKICPYCKIPLVERKGKYGAFYGCANYPRCRYILKKTEE